jgi:hypothetical protein
MLSGSGVQEKRLDLVGDQRRADSHPAGAVRLAGRARNFMHFRGVANKTGIVIQ